MEKARRFIELARKASQIANSDASWQTKYDLIFSSDISEKIKKTEVSCPYYDPDTSYEEDVLAYVSVVNEKADELEKAMVP